MLDGLRDIAARGVRTQHHQHIRKTFREHAEIGARAFGPCVLQPQAIAAVDIDAIEGAGHAIEAGGVDQDVKFVFLLGWS